MLFPAPDLRRRAVRAGFVGLLLGGLGQSTLAEDALPRGTATAPSNAGNKTPVDEGSTPPHPPTNDASDNPATLTGDWSGVRKKLEERGFTFDVALTLDGSKNLRGGIDTAGSAWRNLFEATLTIDAKPLFHIDGGKLFVDFQDQSGTNASLKLVGDAQKFDNIDADGRTEIAQLWYQQILFGEKVRLKIGKVDANSEFEKSDNGGEFLMSSSAFSPTIFPLPTYPDGATSVNVFVKPGGGIYGGLGVYDGSQLRGVLTGAQGPRTFFRDPRDLFLIAEIGRRWGTDSGRLPGRLGIGGWYDTNRVQRFDGGRDSGTGGTYFLFDQTLWRPADSGGEGDARGIGLFVLGGEAEPAVSLFRWHVGGGLAWTGPIPGRPRDVLGAGCNAVGFSREARLASDREVSTELFYRAQITPWASVKPDLQYISTPGGVHRDALVASVRILIAF